MEVQPLFFVVARYQPAWLGAKLFFINNGMPEIPLKSIFAPAARIAAEQYIRPLIARREYVRTITA
jgi:hypothetical protein